MEATMTNEKMNSLKWFSVTKFVSEIHKLQKNQEIKLPNDIIYTIELYFDGHDVFINKFNQICVKPVLIRLNTTEYKEKYIYIKHEDILNMFDGQPVVSCSQNRDRFIPDKNKCVMFSISTSIQDFRGISYYPSYMKYVTMKNTITMINKSRVKIHKDNEETEEEIPLNAF